MSDVECQDEKGTPPCTASDYDHLFIFSFSRGQYQGGGEVKAGQTVALLRGDVSEFNGLAELNVRQAVALDAKVRPELIPEPVLVDKEWFERANSTGARRGGAAGCRGRSGLRAGRCV